MEDDGNEKGKRSLSPEIDCNVMAFEDGDCAEIPPLAIQEGTDSTYFLHPDECAGIEPLEEVGYCTDDDDDGKVVEEINYSTPDGKTHKLTKDSGPTPEPAVGMIFGSWEEVETFFRSYAKQQGFGIVRAHGAYRYRNGKSTGERRTLTWKCERFGNKDTRQRVNGRKVKNHTVSRNGVTFATRKSKKCQCPVSVYSALRPDGDWEIRRVVLDHFGHTPTPHKAKFVCMFRYDAINRVVRRRLFHDLAAGVSIPRIHRSLANQRNGLENTTFTQRDLRNVVARKRREKIEAAGGGDANAMVSYFRKMKEEDPNFYHIERTDEIDRLKDVMWVDARSRAAYKEFPDVVCFDTTYLTNKFKLIFGNFVGVNHHGQSTLFGCALLSHENSETFEWLFSTWVECMGGVKPGGFLTDQCAAMRKALRVVMPESRHRWCLWHILQKFSSKLGSYSKYEEIKDVLSNVIYDSLTEGQFESDWEDAIRQYKLQDNEWLSGLFVEREMWVLAYMKHIFWAGMKTTQRSESINSFFDGYVQKQTMLHEFASQYFAAIEARIDAEEQADADCERSVLEPVTDFRIEIEFQKVYTSAKFYEFQTECMKILYVHVTGQKKYEGSLIELTVLDRVWFRDKNLRKDCPTERTCHYTVMLDERDNSSWCSCKMFECHGIMCRHLIKVFDALQIRTLPLMFIIDRWRKDIERAYTRLKVGYHDPDKTEEVLRIDRMQLVFDDVSLIAAESEEDTERLIDIMEKYRDELVQARALMLSSKEGENVQPSVKDVAALTKSKEGENVLSAAFADQTHNDSTPPCKVAAPPTKKRDNEYQTPPSVKKPNPGPPTKATPGPAESVGIITAQGGSSDAKEAPAFVKDPPLPVNPRHRTTDSRYKSVVEQQTKGRGRGRGSTAAPKPRKMTAKQQLEECTLQLQQQRQALESLQQSMHVASLQQQVQQQQQQMSSFGWMNYSNFPLGGVQPQLQSNMPPQITLPYSSVPGAPPLPSGTLAPRPASFGGIGIPQRNVLVECDTTIGYVTRPMTTQNQNSGWVNSDILPPH